MNDPEGEKMYPLSLWFTAACVVAICAFCWSRQSEYTANGPHPQDIRCPDYNERVIASFKSKVEEATREAANEPPSLEELGQPQFDTFPGTIEVNFYNTPMLRHGYNPEVDFTRQVSRMHGETIEMVDFFNRSEMQKMNYVAVVGGVGYGKTEMLKRITRDVLARSYMVLENIEIVHLVYLQDLENEKKLNVGDLLFRNVAKLTKNEILCGIEYIAKNPQKVLLVLDGLDQYPEKLGQGKSIGIYSEETPNKILSSLISGKIFPDIKILLSSREQAIRHFKGTMRPDRVVALSGFSLASIEKLVKRFGGIDDGKRIWKHLRDRSPTLLSVSSIPMFMMFTVQVLKRAKEAPPETSTEVLMQVLHYLGTSKHATENMIPIISKLKLMSFEGTKAGEVSFSQEDLPNNLSIDEVRDLMISLPGVRFMNQRLVDGHFRLSFCHQSVQEALTALYVVEMPLQKFQSFVGGKLHEPRWVIVRRMVCGLLLNSKTFKIAQGNDISVSLINTHEGFAADLDKKRKILTDSLKYQLEHLQGDGKQKTALLELMHAFHESGDSVKDIIAESTEEINLLNMPLAKSDAHVLFSTIRHCPNLTLLSLINCDFGDDGLALLAKTFKKSKTAFKVRILLLGNYERVLSLKSAEAIRDMLPYVNDFAWLGYKINDTIAQMFQKEKKNVGNPGKIYSWKQDTKIRMVILE